jgi:hypothetical protein
MSSLLERYCEAAETDHDACSPLFVGPDSLASTVTFCRITSEDAFCLLGVQMHWMTLARFLYYTGLLVWVLATSYLPNGIFRKA